ncbi:MAG: cell envelope integrity protein CreD [Hyphomonadaceae bacterium]|nr:cell envelope integrity protein CreD [Hyphomonadaceae bacterium]
MTSTADTSPTPPPGGGPPGLPPLDRFMPKRSAGLKLLLVCGLALLMAIPALFVYGVVHERTLGARQAMNEVAEKVGGNQTVLGPFLSVPYARAPNPEKPDTVVYGTAIAFAETGTADVQVTVEERKRGIYLVPVFDAEIEMEAVFDPQALRDALPSDAVPFWEDARIYSGVSDTRGLRGDLVLTANGQRLSVEPAVSSGYREAGEYNPVPAASIGLAAAELADLETREAPLTLTLSLGISGAERFALAPFAKSTAMTMASNWDHPSFTGGVLPLEHTASEDSVDGFTARWEVPYLARGVPGAGARIDLTQLTNWDARDMAVRFVRPANPYQSVERALKYAAMFVGFVFLTYFLFEVTQSARAHPAQYVLVGLAQSIFYLLLLAFAERMGFDLAFFLAAGMTVGLVSLYSVSVFKSTATGLKAFGVLSGIYGLIYVLMRAEDQALLAGAIASFAAIALTMFMTRNVNWYGERSPA